MGSVRGMDSLLITSPQPSSFLRQDRLPEKERGWLLGASAGTCVKNFYAGMAILG